MKAFDDLWEEIHSSMDWGKYPSEHVIRFVARNYYKVNFRSDVKILDFGCGGGAHTWYLAREGFDTCAFDGSKSAVNKLKERMRQEGLKANVKVLDGINLDYEECFFDSVIDNASVYCSTTENIIEMYNEIKRVLKNKGILYTTAFTTNTTGYGTGEEIEYNTYRNIEKGNLAGRGVTHFYGNGELQKILLDLGYDILHADTLEYEDMGNIVSMILIQAQKVIGV